MTKCKQCGRFYTYNQEVGYDSELCGPMCDGMHHVIHCVREKIEGGETIISTVDLMTAVENMQAELTRLRELNATCEAWFKIGSAIQENTERDVRFGGGYEERKTLYAEHDRLYREMKALIDAMKEPSDA